MLLVGALSSTLDIIRIIRQRERVFPYTLGTFSIKERVFPYTLDIFSIKERVYIS